MISSGPRSGFFVRTFASAPRVQVGRGRLEERQHRRPAPRTCRRHSSASVLFTGVGRRRSGTAGRRACTAWPWFAGLPSTGDADLSAERGSATPRGKAGVDGDGPPDTPPARKDLRSSPPKEWPTSAARLQLADHFLEVIHDLPDGLVREDLGVLLRLLDGIGIDPANPETTSRSPHPRTRRATGPSCSGGNQSPCTKTSASSPMRLPLTASSCSVISAMRCSSTGG